jgi:hypothetical protein
MFKKPIGRAVRIYRPHPNMEYGYGEFEFDYRGWGAGIDQIAADQRRGDTIRTFLAGHPGKPDGFAPISENDTEKYIQFVCNELRATPDDRLDKFSKYAIAGILAKYEGYYESD